MDLGLHGRRALITGGSRGIGFAVAEALAAEGAAVGLVARDAAGLAAAAGRLESRGVPVATAVADVTDTPQLKRAVDDIAAALGGLDHLVANAGGTVGPGQPHQRGRRRFHRDVRAQRGPRRGAHPGRAAAPAGRGRRRRW